MSDENRRRGGGFTFLLAFAAFLMSAGALYQLNQSSIDDKLKDVADRIQKLSEKVGTDSLLSDARSGVSDALSSLLIDENREKAAENVKGSLDRLADYLDDLRGKKDVDEKLVEEVEALQATGQKALDKLDDETADATEEVRQLFHDFKSLDEKIKGK